ncbi:major facilitator superfamily transporter [Niveomyces insectorum RCEF 264]|uniref:Major facilitator superfamily transporter n=1 Tax=Niveomyces insectorum RCEF 264 TaxID=1081102 RepID=A0A162JC44_9HYPO|nr:major facilitator superfamily transporter [Niveomyces insectorum RCEF 264]
MLPFVQVESSPSATAMPSPPAATITTSTSTSSSSTIQIPARPAKVVARTYPAVPAEDRDVFDPNKPASTLAFDTSDLESSRPVTPVEMMDLTNSTSVAAAEAAAAPTTAATVASPHKGQVLFDETPENGRNGVDTGNARPPNSRRSSGGLGTDDEDNGVEVLKSIWFPHKNKFRMATVSMSTLTCGLNDSASGALLPYIEKHYNIGYAIVSLMFVATAVGAIVAAAVVDPLKGRFGRARTFCLGQLLMALGYVPLLTMAAPFPAVVVGFFLVGMGEAVNVAMGNTFCASLQQSTVALGIMHGSYGIGGISGPLIATAIAVASSPDPSTADAGAVPAAAFGRYYVVPFGLMVLCAASSIWSFGGYERDFGENLAASASTGALLPTPASPASADGAAADRRHHRHRHQRWRRSEQPSPPSPLPPPPPPATTSPLPLLRRTWSRLRRVDLAARLVDVVRPYSYRVVLLGALFLFMYQGAEVSLAGWVTSFLIADRGAKEPGVGYVTAGFWAGVTVGRFLLVVPAQRIGARRFVYGCIAGMAGFDLLVWLLPSRIGSAVAVALVGLLIGPIYPSAAAVLMQGMSRRERVAGVSAMTAFGFAGGAVMPFVTGMLAQAVGTFVLHPIFLALLAAMLVFWYLVPARKKPTE